MSSVTLSDFHQNQAQHIAAAQVEPVEFRSCDAQTRTVLVSPTFYEEAMEALRECCGRRTQDELDRWLREDLVQAARDYEENPDDVYALDEVCAELELK